MRIEIQSGNDRSITAESSSHGTKSGAGIVQVQTFRPHIDSVEASLSCLPVQPPILDSTPEGRCSVECLKQ